MLWHLSVFLCYSDRAVQAGEPMTADGDKPSRPGVFALTGLFISEQAMFGEGIGFFRHDHVIECSDINQCEGVFHFFRDGFIGLRGFGQSGRVIVAQNTGRRVVMQGGFDDLTRIHASAVNGASE